MHAVTDGIDPEKRMKPENALNFLTKEIETSSLPLISSRF